MAEANNTVTDQGTPPNAKKLKLESGKVLKVNLRVCVVCVCVCVCVCANLRLRNYCTHLHVYGHSY